MVVDESWCSLGVEVGRQECKATSACDDREEGKATQKKERDQQVDPVRRTGRSEASQRVRDTSWAWLGLDSFGLNS